MAMHDGSGCMDSDMDHVSLAPEVTLDQKPLQEQEEKVGKRSKWTVVTISCVALAMVLGLGFAFVLAAKKDSVTALPTKRAQIRAFKVQSWLPDYGFTTFEDDEIATMHVVHDPSAGLVRKEEDPNVRATLESSSSSSKPSHEDEMGILLFAGTIPTEIGIISDLKYLTLLSYYLTGTIPSEIGLLSDLTSLNLFFNDLTGTVPTEIGLMSSLTRLHFSSNALTGTIPSQLGLISGLESLSLSSNSFIGSMPSELGLLSNLEVLFLHENALTGILATEVGLMSNLTVFGLRQNVLTGPIPSEIGLLSSARYLKFSNNDLSGTVPSEIGLMSSLSFLGLDGNKLEGTLPTEVETMSNLTSLVLFGNNVTVDRRSSMPTRWLEGSVSVDSIDRVTLEESSNSRKPSFATEMRRRLLSENIPAPVPSARAIVRAQSKAARRLNKKLRRRHRHNHHHRLRGQARPPAPRSRQLQKEDDGDTSSQDDDTSATQAAEQWLCGGFAECGTYLPLTRKQQLLALATFYFATNVEVNVTANVTSWTNNTFWLSYNVSECLWYNQASDSVGVEDACDADLFLTTLSLEENNLTGTLPQDGFFERMVALEELDMEDNNLSGTLPSTVATMMLLQDLDLSDNQLTGTLFSELGDMTNLEYLDLSNNVFEGPLPSEFGSMISLQVLYLEGCELTGTLPTEMANMIALEVLDVSFNDFLTGSIPTEIFLLPALQELDLEFSYFEGTIPPDIGNSTSLEVVILTGTLLRNFEIQIAVTPLDDDVLIAQLVFLCFPICLYRELFYRNLTRGTGESNDAGRVCRQG